MRKLARQCSLAPGLLVLLVGFVTPVTTRSPAHIPAGPAAGTRRSETASHRLTRVQKQPLSPALSPGADFGMRGGGFSCAQARNAMRRSVSMLTRSNAL